MNPYVKEFKPPEPQFAEEAQYEIPIEEQYQEYGESSMYEAEQELEAAPLSWSESRRMYEEGQPCTALAFDPEEELLWAGYADGRLTSFTHPEGLKYTSVQAHACVSVEEGAARVRNAVRRSRPLAKRAAAAAAAAKSAAITSVQVFGQGIISVSSAACRLHTRGCLLRASFEGDVELRGVRGAPNTAAHVDGLTCAALNKPALALGPGIDSTTHVTVACSGSGHGTDVPRLYQLDIYGGMLLNKTVDMPVGGAGTAMVCGAMLAVGCEDGCVRLYDAALRSRRAEGSFELHTGPVTALAATVSDGGLRLATAGQAAKSLNIFDKNAPRSLHPDSVVRTFDLRMMRQANAMPCGHVTAAAAPVALSFLQTHAGCDALAVALTTGQLLLSPDPFSDLGGAVAGGVWLEYYQLTDADGTPESVTALAAASSGNVMAVGSASSAVLQLTCTMTESPEEEPKVNERSRPTHLPLYPPAPPSRSIHPMEPRNPAGAYVIRPTARHYYSSGPLSSTLAHTPWVMDAVMRNPPRREIAADVLASMTKQEFLGTVPNPGYLPNSLLHGEGRRMYAQCDPRGEISDSEYALLEQLQQQGGGSAGGGGSKSKSKGKGSEPLSNRELARKDVPSRYRPVSVQLGRGGYDAFDFGTYNATPYAGLENGVPNSYTNAVLQMLYHIPPVRAASLWEQYNPAAHLSGVSEFGAGLTCELGLFFSRLDTARAAPSKSRTSQSTNFLISLKQVHDIASLNLLEGGVNPPLQLPLRIEAFHRFLLYRLHKELSTRPGSAAVDTLYGHDVTTVNKFVSARRASTADDDAKAEDSKVTRNFILELAPQPDNSNSSSSTKIEKSGSGKYFSDALLRSLSREAKTQAWSSETGKYAPIIQTRTVTSLPALLAIHCSPLTGVESSSSTSSSSTQPPSPTPASPVSPVCAYQSPFRGDNCTGGPWLPEEIRIHLPDTTSTATATAAATATAKGLSVSERADPPLDIRGGNRGESTWYTAGAGAAEQHKPPGGVRYKLFAVISHVAAAKAKKSKADDSKDDSTASKGHLVLHVKETTVKRAPPAAAAAAAAAAAVVASKSKKATVENDGDTPPSPVMTSETTSEDVTAPAVNEAEQEATTATDDTAEESTAVAEPAVSQPVAATEASVDSTSDTNTTATAAAAAAAAAVADAAPAPDETPDSETPESEAPAETATDETAAAVTDSADAVDAGSGTATAATAESNSEQAAVQAAGVDAQAVAAAADQKASNAAVNDGEEEDEKGDAPWLLFNDFLVERTVLEDARGFKPSWKEPCILLYQDVSQDRVPLALYQEPPPSMTIDPAIFNAPTLAKNGKQPVIPADKLPRRGTIVAIDAEFVSLELEEARLRSDGSRVVTREGRQGLARVSALNARGEIILDDYVLQSEPVVDHLTRFSGITPQDLDPFTSRHSLVPLRVAYLKLRCLVDRGCILLGHGLAKDLRVMNLAVRPSQVVDTSDLWSLPGQRKVSLRFLSFYLLKERIQEQTHDSIIDSNATLGLYNKYKEIAAQGPEALQKTLKELYKCGYNMEWKVRDRGAEDGPHSPLRTTSRDT